MKKRLYVAYGSNLNKRQMSERCPGAKFVGAGVIHGYELQFKGLYSSAFATIAPKQGAKVAVGVWEIQDTDEWSLDVYEGYPRHYFKETVRVELKETMVSAMVYVMNLNAKFGVPSVHYFGVIKEGYKDCGLDESVLNQALLKSYEQAVKEPGERFRRSKNHSRSNRNKKERTYVDPEETSSPENSWEGQMHL